MNIQQTISDWVSALLPSNGYILEVKIQPRPQRVVLVIIDTDSGITIDECAQISRELGKKIEENDLLGEEPYTLEVSSPGIDYPLTQMRQFVKNIHRKIQVSLIDGSQKVGILEQVTDTYIELRPELPFVKGKKIKTEKEATLPFQVPYSQIKQANVLVSF